MKKDKHVDPDLFDLFLRSGAYLEYAEQFLRPEQIDKVDINNTSSHPSQSPRKRRNNAPLALYSFFPPLKGEGREGSFSVFVILGAAQDPEPRSPAFVTLDPGLCPG